MPKHFLAELWQPRAKQSPSPSLPWSARTVGASTNLLQLSLCPWSSSSSSSSVFWLFHALEQTTAIAVLPSMDLVCGTVFLINWDHLTSLWLRSGTNWSRYYLKSNCFSTLVASCKSVLYKYADDDDYYY